LAGPRWAVGGWIRRPNPTVARRMNFAAVALQVGKAPPCGGSRWARRIICLVPHPRHEGSLPPSLSKLPAKTISPTFFDTSTSAISYSVDGDKPTSRADTVSVCDNMPQTHTIVIGPRHSPPRLERSRWHCRAPSPTQPPGRRSPALRLVALTEIAAVAL